MSDAPLPLPVQLLTRANFAAFGEVIDAAEADRVIDINSGTAQRFHALAHVATDAIGCAIISIFRAQPRDLPFTLHMLERHPLGSQAFVPLSARPYLVVVASDPHEPPRAFLARPHQGVNIGRGVWHHPLLALEATSDFLVIDRAGPGANCDEVRLARAWRIAPLDR